MDGRTTPSCTACRCSTCTAWCSACSGALRARQPAACTPAAPPRRRTRAAGRHALLRRADRLVPDRADPAAAARAARRPAAGLRQRAAAGAGLRARCAELTGHAPVERYGMTETLITVSARADGERRPGSVGLPLAGVRDPARRRGRRAGPHDGETSASCRCAARRCSTATWAGRTRPRQPAPPTAGSAPATSRRSAPDGCHRIVGRASTDLIKTGGYRIGAGEVEDALLRPPGGARGGGGRRARRRPRAGDRRVRRRRRRSTRASELIDFVAARLVRAQAAARGAPGRRAAAQRDGQGAEEAAPPGPGCGRRPYLTESPHLTEFSNLRAGLLTPAHRGADLPAEGRAADAGSPSVNLPLAHLVARRVRVRA